MFSYLQSVFTFSNGVSSAAPNTLDINIPTHSRSISETSDDWTLLNPSPALSPLHQPAAGPSPAGKETASADQTPLQLPHNAWNRSASFRVSFADIIKQKNSNLSSASGPSIHSECAQRAMPELDVDMEDAASEQDSDVSQSETDDSDPLSPPDDSDSTVSDITDSGCTCGVCDFDPVWEREYIAQYDQQFKYDTEFSIHDKFIANHSRGGRSQIKLRNTINYRRCYGAYSIDFEH
jgi:hypothetical protein